MAEKIIAITVRLRKEDSESWNIQNSGPMAIRKEMMKKHPNKVFITVMKQKQLSLKNGYRTIKFLAKVKDRRKK